MKIADYSATIIYFKISMKYLNVRETISIIKITLFNNCFKNDVKRLKI